VVEASPEVLNGFEYKDNRLNSCRKPYCPLAAKNIDGIKKLPGSCI
jgi:hypothetical protein